MRTLLVAAVLLLVLAIGRAAGQGADDIVRACAEPFGDGTVADAGLVHAAGPDGACPAGWRTLAWVRQGPAGPDGFPGARGPVAAPGPQGEAGPAGRDAVGYVDRNDLHYAPKQGRLERTQLFVDCPSGFVKIGAGWQARDETSRPFHPVRQMLFPIPGGFNANIAGTGEPITAGPLCWRAR